MQQSEGSIDMKRSLSQLQEDNRQQAEVIKVFKQKENRLSEMNNKAIEDLRIIEGLKKDIVSLRDDVETQKKKVEPSTQQIFKLQEQLDICQREKSYEERRVIALEGESILAEQRYDRVKDELADQVSRVSALEASNEQLDKGISTLRKERQSNIKLIELLQKDLQDAQTLLSHSKSDHDNMYNKVLRLEDELFALLSRLEPIKGELARAEKSVKFLTADKTALQETVASLREERYKLEERMISVEEEKSTLESEVSALNDEKLELQDALEKKTAEVRNMMARRVSIEGANEAMGVAVSVEKRLKEVLVEDRKRLQESVNTLELEKEELLEDVKIHIDDINTLNKELTACKASKDKWKKDMDRLRMDLMDRDIMAERVEAELFNLRTENEELRREKIALEKAVEQQGEATRTIVPNMPSADPSSPHAASSRNEERIKSLRAAPPPVYTTPWGVVDQSSDIYTGMMQLSEELVAARSTIMSLEDQIANMKDEILQQQRQHDITAQAQVMPYLKPHGLIFVFLISTISGTS